MGWRLTGLEWARLVVAATGLVVSQSRARHLRLAQIPPPPSPCFLRHITWFKRLSLMHLSRRAVRWLWLCPRVERRRSPVRACQLAFGHYASYCFLVVEVFLSIRAARVIRAKSIFLFFFYFVNVFKVQKYVRSSSVPRLRYSKNVAVDQQLSRVALKGFRLLLRRRVFVHDLASDHRARLISRKYDIKQHFSIWLWIIFVLQGMHFEAFGTCV